MRTSSFVFSFVVCCAGYLAFDSVAVGDEHLDTHSDKSNGDKAKSCPIAGPVEIRDFEVRVDNKPTGTHRLTIKSDGDLHEVTFQTDVKMDYLVYAYVFKFRGTEVWRDGRLDQVDIRCEDGGKKRSVGLKTVGDVQTISFNGKAVPSSSPGQMTTAYWRLPPTQNQTEPFTIVDADTGAIHDVTLKVVGKSTISCSGKSLECRHVKIDGPSPAELWFDDHDRLVKRTSVEEGHQLELRLKQIRTVKNE